MRLGIFVFAAFAIVALGVMFLWPKPTPESVAREALACFENREAACLLDLTHPNEIAALELDEESLGEMLGIAHREYLAGSESTEEFEVIENPGGEVRVTQRYGGPNRARTMIAFSAGQFDDEVKLYGVVRSISTAGLFVISPEEPAPTGQAKMQRIVNRYADWHQRGVGPVGFVSYADDEMATPGYEPFLVMKWEDALERYRRDTGIVPE
jgi:hypothetical protein